MVLDIYVLEANRYSLPTTGLVLTSFKYTASESRLQEATEQITETTCIVEYLAAPVDETFPSSTAPMLLKAGASIHHHLDIVLMPSFSIPPTIVPGRSERHA